MTYAAREVLEDCRTALQMLEDEQDLRQWRIHWAAAVALIRAVGHVLEKVDGSKKPVKDASNQLYKEWMGVAREHLIFREFIVKERNNILKEYQFNIHPLVAVPVVIQGVSRTEGSIPPTIVVSDVLELGDNIYRPLMEGPWEGEDARSVLMEAIEWWSDQLDNVDKISAALC